VIPTWSLPQSGNERQHSVNNFVGCILCIPQAVPRHLSIIEVLAAFTGNIVCVDTATPPSERQQSINRASTERQQSVNRASTEHQHRVNRASKERQQSINTASTERQQSVNDFGYCILNHPKALLWQISVVIVLAAVLSKSDRDIVTASL